MVAISEKQDGRNEKLERLLLQHGPALRRYYAILFAVGLSNENVEKIMNTDLETVESFRDDKHVTELISDIQMAMGMSPEKRLAASTQAAIDVKLMLLRTGDHRIQNAVSTELLDRNLGKPLQTTQNINANLNVNASPAELDVRLQQAMDRLLLLEEKKKTLLNSQ